MYFQHRSRKEYRRMTIVNACIHACLAGHDSKTHHTHRRQRTILCTGPRSQPEAWLSLHQRRILNNTQKYAHDPAYLFREQSGCSVRWQMCSQLIYTHLDIVNLHFGVECNIMTTQMCKSCIFVELCVLYHRRRWLPDDFFPAVEPIYSRSHGRLGKSLPAHWQKTLQSDYQLTQAAFSTLNTIF